jgi:hypothetical protein
VRLLAAAALIGGPLLAPATAHASGVASRCPIGQPCVAVIVGGAVIDTFTPSQIESGDIQNDPVYEVRQPHGSACTDSDPIAAGSSIYALLNQATVSLTTDGHVEVTSSGGASIDLTAAQVSADGGGQFYDGQIPVVYGNGDSSSLAFIRGLLASPAPCPPDGPVPGADSNAGAQGDFFGVSEIDLTVYGGPTLSVTMTPSPAATTPGKDVTFTANVVGGGKASYTYHWTFGDGGAATTSVDHVTYAYDVAGSYLAQVTVDGSDNSTGISAADQVTVGNHPPTSGSTPNGGGRSPAPGPTAGPAKGRGHRSGAPATGTQAGVDTTGRSSPSQQASTTAIRHARHADLSTNHLTLVSGQLLGAPTHFVAVTEVKSSPLVVGSAPAAAAGSGAGPLALSCGIAIAALLVAGGAARELRRVPPASLRRAPPASLRRVPPASLHSHRR